MNSRRDLATVVVAVLCVIALFGLGIFFGMAIATPEKVVPKAEITLPNKAVPGGETITADLDNNYGESNQDLAQQPVTEAGVAIHEDLRDETPPGVDQADVNKIENSDPKNLTAPTPVGGAQNYSCPNNFVRNWSERSSGTHVSLFVLHYTVSRPGSLDAIRRLFDRPSFGASSHLGLEPSGRCQLWVPFAKKAWTEGAFNSVSDSVEIVCCNTVESRSWWLSQPIFSKQILAGIIVDRLRARGIPPRRVDPVGCNVQQAGYTDHDALECGNDHHDVAPNFPWDVLGKQITQRYNAGQVTRLPGPVPKPAWFWDACGEWISGQFTGLSGPSPKPTWFWDACGKWIESH